MIEDHFDVDDEMTSVKWKDKEALKNDQGILCVVVILHCMSVAHLLISLLHCWCYISE